MLALVALPLFYAIVFDTYGMDSENGRKNSGNAWSQFCCINIYEFVQLVWWTVNSDDRQSIL